MRNHDDRQNDAGDHIPDDHLNEEEVPSVSHGRNANDRERAGFGRDDGKANAPPLNVFAAEKVVAGVALIFAEPDSQPDDCEQIANNNGPVREREMVHRQILAA